MVIYSLEIVKLWHVHGHAADGEYSFVNLKSFVHINLDQVEFTVKHNYHKTTNKVKILDQIEATFTFEYASGGYSNTLYLKNSKLHYSPMACILGTKH